MVKEEPLKILLDESITSFSSDILGIDMGQSLTKMSWVEKNELNLFLFQTFKSNSIIKEFLGDKKDSFKKVNFTGGKSFNLYKEYLKDFNANLINEFAANVKGIEIFHLLEKKKALSASLIVTIGTGTSMIMKRENFEHLGGSAIGGGFFMGLIKSLFNLTDFKEIINLARKGNRYNVDLKVSDIYAPEDDRIDLLFREFTASSLGKIDVNFDLTSLKKEDFINSLICLIGENIGTIANLMANNNNINEIVFCGGFLRENKVLKKILSVICKLNKKKAIFLKNPEFCAAVGALFF